MKTKAWWLVGAAAVWCVAVTAVLAEGTTKVRAEEHADSCTQEAKALHGDERSRALAECARQEHASASTHGEGHHSQQEKMKTCNVEAGQKNLHGEERRAFMSSCLKG